MHVCGIYMYMTILGRIITSLHIYKLDYDICFLPKQPQHVASFSPDIRDGCYGDCFLVVPTSVPLSEVKGLPYPPKPTGTVHPVESTA